MRIASFCIDKRIVGGIVFYKHISISYFTQFMISILLAEVRLDNFYLTFGMNNHY